MNYVVTEIRFKVARETFAAERVQTRPMVSDPATAAALCRDERIIPDDSREHFVVLLLNAQNHLVAFHRVSTGTLSASIVHPREVFAPALRTMGVASLILVHNHPSGHVAPSREDLSLTRQLVDGARLLDLTIHDHVILGDGTGAHHSMAEAGQL